MVLGMFDPKCPQCGKPVSRQAKFCGNCGAALSGGKIVCGVCGVENNADAKFCRGCGRPLAQSAAPEVQRHRWARRDDDFAVRIDAEDLPGTLKRGLVIEPGTNAILIEHGTNRGMVPPGNYVLENAGQKLWDWLTNGIPERATALLVDVTPTELLFNLGGRFTSDPLPIGVTVRLQVDVAEPGKFLINLLKGRERLSKEDIRQYLYPEVVQVVDRWLRQHTLQDLAEDAGQHEKLELTLEEALKTTFGQTGLRFLQIRAVELNLEPYDKVKGIRGKYALWTMETTAELEGRKGALALSAEANRVEEDEQERRDREIADRKERLAKEEVERKARYASLQHEVDLQALAEETCKVQMQEDRVQLYQRMRQAVSSDKMNEVRSEADFDRFMSEIDYEKLLREKERQDLQRVWKEEGEDHDRARAHLLAKLDIEGQFEERGLRARLQHSEDVQTIDNEIEIARKRADYDFETRRKNVDIEIELERKRREIELEREKIEEERQQRKRDLDRLTQQQKLEDERRARQQDREEDRADAVMGLELLAKMKENRQKDEESRLALQRLDEEERLRIHRVDELERSKLQQSLALERMEAEERLRQAVRDHEFKVQQNEQAYQLERMRLAANMGPEALISLSGPEQARILADLKKTEALKGMSEEQILAMAAEHFPAVAQALQEKFRAIASGQTSQEVTELYERLLKEREAAVETARRQQAENERLLREDADKRARDTSQAWEKATAQSKETTERAIDRMADVAQAFARNPAQPPAPVIVNNPAGVPQVIQPGMGVGPAAHNPLGAELKTCPKCGHSVVADEHYCEHCGQEFEGMG
jgi:colicin import membrane protein